MKASSGSASGNSASVETFFQLCSLLVITVLAYRPVIRVFTWNLTISGSPRDLKEKSKKKEKKMVLQHIFILDLVECIQSQIWLSNLTLIVYRILPKLSTLYRRWFVFVLILALKLH